MASNDMNSWDEDPDELLRQRWQQTFANFEVRPRSSLSRRILNQLPTGNRRRPVLWIAGGLLLFMGGLLYKGQLGEHPKAGRSNATVDQSATPIQRLLADRVRQPATLTEQTIPPGLLKAAPRPSEVVAKQQPTAYSPTVSGVEALGVETPGMAAPRMKVLPGHRMIMGQLPAGQVQPRPWARTRLRTNAIAIHQPRSKSVRFVDTRFSAESSGSVEPVDYKSMVTLPNQLIRTTNSSSPDPQLAINQPLVNAVPIEWTRLKSLGILAIPSQLSTLPDHLPAISWGAPHSVKSAVAHPSPHWFVDVMPLSSFQWMSAPPASATYLSHVDAPAAFSPATWGYQINGGMRFQRWRAYLSVGQLRRWAYYTVNENRYRINPSSTDPNQLVRETYAVAENVALPMIGAGLSQERLLAQGRYAVELGGQVSYLTTSNQTLIGLRSGASRRLPVGRTMLLQVGITAEYGLNRLLNEQRQLAIHPFVVGLGLRIQPRLEH